MKKTILSSLFLCGICLGHAEGNLQEALESSYKNYTDAVNNHDLEKLRTSMSAHGYMHLKNFVASQKLKYPEDLIVEASVEMVNLKKEKFLSAKENAITAKSVYFGKSFNYAKAIVVLCFIKENDKWKFDGIEEKSSNEIITNVESNKLAFVENELMLSESTPQVETEVASVDYNGWFNLNASGYNLQMKVNGTPQEVKNGVVVNGVILGGLRDGKNLVEMTLTPKENGDKSGVRLSMRGYINNAERDVTHLFEANPGETITREFDVLLYDQAH